MAGATIKMTPFGPNLSRLALIKKILVKTIVMCVLNTFGIKMMEFSVCWLKMYLNILLK